MIWHRHWLELRATAFALIGTAVIASLFFIRDSDALSNLEPDMRRELSYGPLRSLTDSLGAAQINLIVFHEEFSWIAIVLLSLFLAGDGLKVSERWTGAQMPSAAQFTLSLPVSRRQVVMTRFASTYVVAALVLFIIAGTNAAVFATTSHPVPLEQLALASAFASLLVLFWSSLFVLVPVILGPRWGMAFTLVAMIVSTAAGMHGMSASAALSMDIGLVVLFAVALGFVLAGAVTAAASEEV